MPTFKYQAKDAAGKTVSGTVSARTQADVLGDLRRRNLIVLNVKQAGQGLSINTKMFSKRTPRPQIKRDDLVVWTRQLSTMISAGIPLLESLEILKEQSRNPGFTRAMDDIIDMIRSGSDLSVSLEKYPKVFSNIFTSMVRAGEVSGQLDEILQRLAEYMEAAAKLKREIKSAMTYPVVSLVLVLGITSFLMIGIVPKFKEVFESLSNKDGTPLELPALTKYVLDVSLAIQAHWDMVALGAIAAFFGLMAYKKTDRGARQFDWVMLHIPIFGSLFQKVALSRFSRTFATLIKSGVPILGALEIVSATSGNRIVASAIDDARENVRQGDTLAEPLSRSAVFPPMVTRMIAIGEKSGALETLLEKISIFYDDQVSATVKALTSMIEPLMIGFMGFLVGGIVLAVFLPIFKLQESLA
jgi:type IV pilus assembly protein PilC